MSYKDLRIEEIDNYKITDLATYPGVDCLICDLRRKISKEEKYEKYFVVCNNCFVKARLFPFSQKEEKELKTKLANFLKENQKWQLCTQL